MTTNDDKDMYFLHLEVQSASTQSETSSEAGYIEIS